MREGINVTECDWLHARYGYPKIKVSGAGFSSFNGVYRFLGPDPASGGPIWRGGMGTLSSHKDVWMLWTIGEGIQIAYVSLHDTPFPAALILYTMLIPAELLTTIVIAREYST